ncbi:MAG: DsbA family protein [Proteobacteria bacterium]|nr:DsbA family protein [Pseudomonadota bacterium]MBU1687205.1 DsbA family protein [Pseudomonadota bacterium]
MAEPALAELAASDNSLIINWRAFELRPEPVELLDPNGEYLTSAWRDHVYPLAAKMKLPMKRPPIQPRSRLAHEAAKWAGSHNRLAEYNLALFRAFFEFGRDIGSQRVLMDLASEQGLDPEALARALDSHQFIAEVLGDEEDASRLGVRAVPSFVANGRVLAAGVQTAERLRELMANGPRGLALF